MPIGAYKPVGDKAQGGCRPGAAALHQYIIGRWGAGVGSFGCYNPNSRAGNGWSLHREGRAIDVSIAQGYQHKGDDIFHWTIRNADSLGLQEIQWAGKIWTSRRSQEGIRADTSPAGKLHYDHVHIGLAEGWSFTPPSDSPSRPPQGDEDLTPEEREWLRRVYIATTDSNAGLEARLVRVENAVNAVKSAILDGPYSIEKVARGAWAILVTRFGPDGKKGTP